MAQRMAGEELTKYGSLGDRFGEDYVDRVKGDGRQDGNKYSRKELASEFRYGRGDTSVDDTVAKYQEMVDSGNFKGNNKAQDFLEMHGVNFGNGEDSPDVSVPDVEPAPTPTPAPSPTPGPDTPGNPGPTPIELPVMGSGSQTQIVNQDNDVNTNVTGDGNVTNINQDNSVGQYGAYGSSTARSKALRDKYVADISKFVRN